MFENSLLTSADKAPEVLPSILIPLATRSLLVPTVAVAEIVGYQPPQAIDNAPDWLLGHFSWRDQQVPLLSLELLCGEALLTAQASNRVAVFNNTGTSEQLPFIAIATRGIPRLVQASAKDLGVSAVEARPFESLRVLLHGEEATIPDISALEHVYLDWENRQPGQ